MDYVFKFLQTDSYWLQFINEFSIKIKRKKSSISTVVLGLAAWNFVYLPDKLQVSAKKYPRNPFVGLDLSLHLSEDKVLCCYF